SILNIKKQVYTKNVLTTFFIVNIIHLSLRVPCVPGGAEEGRVATPLPLVWKAAGISRPRGQRIGSRPYGPGKPSVPPICRCRQTARRFTHPTSILTRYDASKTWWGCRVSPITRGSQTLAGVVYGAARRGSVPGAV